MDFFSPIPLASYGVSHYWMGPLPAGCLSFISFPLNQTMLISLYILLSLDDFIFKLSKSALSS